MIRYRWFFSSSEICVLIRPDDLSHGEIYKTADEWEKRDEGSGGVSNVAERLKKGFGHENGYIRRLIL